MALPLISLTAAGALAHRDGLDLERVVPGGRHRPGGGVDLDLGVVQVEGVFGAFAADQPVPVGVVHVGAAGSG
jgi:hypothetical protein